MLILALLLRAFQPMKPASRGCVMVFPRGREQEPLHLAVFRRLHLVAQIPFSGFGGRKGTSSMGKMSILEVLRLRAHKRCVTR